MLIKKLTQELLNKFYNEINNNENKIRIQKNILDPIVNYIYQKLFTQFLTIIVLFLIITFLSIINFCILISIYFAKKN
jgi:hypothetical protein